MFLKNLFLIVVAIVITVGAVASPALAHPDHYENVWVKDQPRGHWDQVLVATPVGNRYEPRWVWDPPSGHQEIVLVHEYHPEYPVFVPVVPYSVYYAPSRPYYAPRRLHPQNQRCR